MSRSENQLITLFKFHLYRHGISLSSLAKSLEVYPNDFLDAVNKDADPVLLDRAFMLTLFDPSVLNLEEAHALEKVVESWNKSHADFLSQKVASLGLDPKSLPGLPQATWRRWTSLETRPRPVGLMPFLMQLGVSPLELAPLEGVNVGEDLNMFAYELRALMENLGLSMAQFSNKIDVSRNMIQSMVTGRDFPQDSAIRARLEYAVGVKVSNVRSESARALESDTPVTNLGRLFHSQRHAKSLSRRELSELSGVGLNAIINIETGEEPNSYFSVLRRLADVLELGYDEVAFAIYGPLKRDTFSERLRFARLTRLITIKEISDQLGMHAFVYRRYEEGHEETGEPAFPGRTKGRLEAMLEVLGVSQDELFNPDKGAFTSWLSSEIKTHGADMLALIAGVTPETIIKWSSTEQRPTFRQASDLSRFCGYPKTFARTLITG